MARGFRGDREGRQTPAGTPTPAPVVSATKPSAPTSAGTVEPSVAAWEFGSPLVAATLAMNDVVYRRNEGVISTAQARVEIAAIFARFPTFKAIFPTAV